VNSSYHCGGVTALVFALAFLAFTYGPGAVCSRWLTHNLDWPRQLIASLGIGVALSAVMIDVLGRTGFLRAFPVLAIVFTLQALFQWRIRAGAPHISDQKDVSSEDWNGHDLAAAATIVVLALVSGYVVFAHRVAETSTEVVLYGDYDSLDLSYYAAVSAEAVHTVPPTAPYYSGHELNYAYYPQLVLAMVHRFAGVSMLDIYFKFAWPAFLVVAMLAAFLLTRSIATTGTAFLAVALIMFAGDFSYLAAWYLPHENFNWDYVLWPTNFLAPTMETLHFNSWTPSMPILFTGLWCFTQGCRLRSTHGRSQFRWLAMAAVLFGVLFQFKPFAFIVLSAALVAASIFSGGDREARWRYLATLVAGGAVALPFVYRSLRLYADRRSELRIDYFVLPLRMLIKLDLFDQLTAWSGRVAPVPWMARPLLLGVATLLFLAGGLGVRLLGARPLWRALNASRSEAAAIWRLLAWIVIAGIAIPFVLVTEPYNDTLQFYQTGLYVAWLFTAVALTDISRRGRFIGAAAIAVALLCALPSSIHYLARRWTDGTRPALAGLTTPEIQMAGYLRTLDPERTVVLNDRPLEPSLLTVLSERRVVLAWGRYAVGSNERLREVEAFYRSSRDLSALMDVLRKYNVTHVVVHRDVDRVHPDVIARLKPLMGSDVVQLYEVPEALKH
jgi:hypothetical protein